MIHFLPGMGATSSLYGKEWRLESDVLTTIIHGSRDLVISTLLKGGHLLVTTHAKECVSVSLEN